MPRNFVSKEFTGESKLLSNQAKLITGQYLSTLIMQYTTLACSLVCILGAEFLIVMAVAEGNHLFSEIRSISSIGVNNNDFYFDA